MYLLKDAIASDPMTPASAQPGREPWMAADRALVAYYSGGERGRMRTEDQVEVLYIEGRLGEAYTAVEVARIHSTRCAGA